MWVRMREVMAESLDVSAIVDGLLGGVRAGFVEFGMRMRWFCEVERIGKRELDLILILIDRDAI
jgi:hypothetical protein